MNLNLFQICVTLIPCVIQAARILCLFGKCHMSSDPHGPMFCLAITFSKIADETI